jgi:hypothetical protein
MQMVGTDTRFKVHTAVLLKIGLVGCYTVPRRVVTYVSKGFFSRQHDILTQNT